MARISDRLVIQLVDDRIVFLDESAGNEVVVTKEWFDTIDQGFQRMMQRNTEAWLIPDNWENPNNDLSVQITADECEQAYEAFQYLRRYVV